MHDKPTGASDAERTPTAALDLRDQAIVLTHVLALYPACLRLVELVREICAGSADFAEGDRFERAARDLVGVGLLFEVGTLVQPTWAALRFNEIIAVGV